eukprot:3018172-Rhodomonas_salina.1
MLSVALDELHHAPTFIGEDLRHQGLGEGILLLHEQFLDVDSGTMKRVRQSVDTITLLVQRTVPVAPRVAVALPFLHGAKTLFSGHHVTDT